MYFSSPISIMVWPALVGAAAHGLRWFTIDVIGQPATVGVGIACLFASTVLIPLCRKLHIPFTAIGFASVVALMPGVYLFRAASGAVELLTATGESLTALVAAVAQDSATAAMIIVAMIIGLGLPVAITDHLFGALRSASSCIDW